MSEELKPCPFCGGSGTMRKTRDVYGTFCYAECLECGAIARGVYSMSDERAESSAAKRWNRRAERTCGELRGEPRHDAIGYSAAHEDDELWCEHCDIELDDSWRFCPNCGSRITEVER